MTTNMLATAETGLELEQFLTPALHGTVIVQLSDISLPLKGGKRNCVASLTVVRLAFYLLYSERFHSKYRQAK